MNKRKCDVKSRRKTLIKSQRSYKRKRRICDGTTQMRSSKWREFTRSRKMSWLSNLRKPKETCKWQTKSLLLKWSNSNQTTDCWTTELILTNKRLTVSNRPSATCNLRSSSPNSSADSAKWQYDKKLRWPRTKKSHDSSKISRSNSTTWMKNLQSERTKCSLSKFTSIMNRSKCRWRKRWRWWKSHSSKRKRTTWKKWRRSLLTCSTDSSMRSNCLMKKVPWSKKRVRSTLKPCKKRRKSFNARSKYLKHRSKKRVDWASTKYRVWRSRCYHCRRQLKTRMRSYLQWRRRRKIFD